MQEMTPPVVDEQSNPHPAGSSRRPFTVSIKGGIALLVCFLVGVAAAALLIYTLL